MTLQTVLIVVEHLGVNEVTRCGSGERWFKIIRTLGTFSSPRPGILSLHHEHQGRESSCYARPLGPNLPLDASARKSVQHEHPRGHERRRHVGPIRSRTPSIVGEIQSEGSEINAGQGDARNERQDGRQERRPTGTNRLPIWAVVRVSEVHQTKHNCGHHDQEAQDQVQQEHPEVEPALAFLALHGDRNQVHRIHHDQCEQRKDNGEYCL